MVKRSKMESEAYANNINGGNRDDYGLWQLKVVPIYSTNTSVQLNVLTSNIPENYLSQNEFPSNSAVSFMNTVETQDVLTRNIAVGSLQTSVERNPNRNGRLVNITVWPNTLTLNIFRKPYSFEEHLALTHYFDEYMNLTEQPETLTRNDHETTSYTHSSTYLGQNELTKNTNIRLKHIEHDKSTRNVPESFTRSFFNPKELEKIYHEYLITVQQAAPARSVMGNPTDCILDQNDSNILGNNSNIALQRDFCKKNISRTSTQTNLEHYPTKNILYNNLDTNVQHDGSSVNISEDSTQSVLEQKLITNILKCYKDSPTNNYIPNSSTNIFDNYNHSQQDTSMRNFVGPAYTTEQEIASTSSDMFNNVFQRDSSTRIVPRAPTYSYLEQNEPTSNSNFTAQRNQSISNIARVSTYTLDEAMTSTKFDSFDNAVQKDTFTIKYSETSLESCLGENLLAEILNGNSDTTVQKKTRNIPGSSTHTFEDDITWTNDILEDIEQDTKSRNITTTFTTPYNFINSNRNNTMQHNPWAKNVPVNCTYKSLERIDLITDFPASSANTNGQQNKLSRNILGTPEEDKLTRTYPKYFTNITVGHNASTTKINESFSNKIVKHNAATNTNQGSRNSTVEQYTMGNCKLLKNSRTISSEKCPLVENIPERLTSYTEDENACSLLTATENPDITYDTYQKSYLGIKKIEEKYMENKTELQSPKYINSRKHKKVFRPLQIFPNNSPVNGVEPEQYIRLTIDEETSEICSQNQNRNRGRSHNHNYNLNPNDDYTDTYYYNENNKCSKNRHYKTHQNYNQNKNSKQHNKKNNEENKQTNNSNKHRKKK